MKQHRRILVLSSTYPIDSRDDQPSFVKTLTQGLANDFEIDILIPSIQGNKSHHDNIYTFRYFFSKYEILTGGSGINQNLKKNPLLWLVLPLFFLAQIISIRKLITKNKYDLIHAHWIIPQGLSLYLARLGIKHPPLLITSHGGDLYTNNIGLTHKIKGLILKTSTHVTVVSKSMKDYCLDHYNLASSSISIAPMGVNLTSKFIPIDIKNPEFDILFIGRLVPKKGAEILIKASARLIHEHPELKVAIIGEGVLKEQLIRLTESNNLKHNITFFGSVNNEELPQHIANSKIVALPFQIDNSGDQEGLGLTTIEAQGCARPVVVGDVPAIHDVVKNNKTGIIVTSKDHEELADEINSLLINKEKRKYLAANGRLSALMFDWDNVIQNYKTIIQRLINGTKA